MSAPVDDTRYARLAARALADEATPAPTPISLGHRAADVAVIERELRTRGRRGARLSLAALSVTAAVAALVAISWRWQPAPRSAPSVVARVTARPAVPPPPPLAIAAIEGARASLVLAGTARAAAVDEEIVAGTRVEVPRQGRLALALATGTRLDVGGGSVARVAELGALQRFELETGTLVAQVAKLEPGRRFVVATPDAEVEVRGTRFTVAVGDEAAPCGPPVRTRVSVAEGVVVVRHGTAEERLVAGVRWPDCAPESARGPAVVRRPKVAAARAAALRTVAEDAAAEALRASTLAEQNDLFAAALAAGRRGDVDQARHWLDQLVARYPNGPLVDSARAERQRLAAAVRPRTSAD